MTQSKLETHSPQHKPHFTATLAMIWFIAGLAMLFGAAMIGYVMIRVNRIEDVPVGSLHLPRTLWLSTALVLIASFTIQAAVTAAKRERQKALRGWLLASLLIGIAFVAVQAPSLAGLVRQHLDLMATFDAARARGLPIRPQPFFGLIFMFILIHAAHVAGGIVQLIFVTRGAFKNRFDHEYFSPVLHAAMYWHFLDVVWLIMFGVIFGAG